MSDQSSYEKDIPIHGKDFKMTVEICVFYHPSLAELSEDQVSLRSVANVLGNDTTRHSHPDGNRSCSSLKPPKDSL